MRPKRYSRLAALFILAPLLLLATPLAAALGLLEAHDAALQNDPTWRAALREHEAGQQYGVLGRSHLLPSVSASYARSRNNADVTTTGQPTGDRTEDRDYTSLAATLQLRQPLYHPEGLARYRQGLAQTRGSDAQLALRAQDLVVRVAALYTTAKLAEDQLALAVAQRDAYAEQRMANQRLLQRGEGTQTDVLETQARLDLAIAQVLEATDARTNARNALGAMVGRDIEVLEPLADDFRPTELVPRDFASWRALALASSPDLQLQQAVVEVAREEAARTRAGHMPRLDLVASAGRNNSDTINTFNQKANVRSVGVQLVVPLYAGGATSAAITQAEANHQRALADLDARTSALLIELRKQHDLATTSVSRLAAATAAFESARVLVDATQKSVRGGQRTNLDVLQAQQQLFDARRDVAQSRYNHLLALLRLRHAAGVLNRGDLAEMARSFRSGGRAG